jgi:peptidylprolyl isomerase
MKLRLIAATVAALLLTTGIAVAQDTSTEKGKLSYALGYNLGRNAIESGEQIDINAVIKGLQDGFAKKDTAVPMDQLRAALEAMQKRQDAKAKAEYEKMAADNKTRSDTFLAQNKAKAGVKPLGAKGVTYRVIEAGNGAKPTGTSTVNLEFAGPFLFGERRQPMPAPKATEIKVSGVQIQALREVLLQMPAGSKWEVTLPAEAYPVDPRQFPPNVAVQFEIKLISVK